MVAASSLEATALKNKSVAVPEHRSLAFRTERPEPRDARLLDGAPGLLRSSSEDDVLWAPQGAAYRLVASSFNRETQQLLASVPRSVGRGALASER